MCYMLCLEEYWLLHFTGNYLDFNNHTHLLKDCDNALRDCYVDQLLALGELHLLENPSTIVNELFSLKPMICFLK